MSLKTSNYNSTCNQILTSTRLISHLYLSEIATKLKMNSSTFLVLISLCYHYNPQNKDSFPGQNYISLKTGLSISSVKRSIKDLLSKGLIVKYRNKYGNVYKFTTKFFDTLNLTPEKDQNESRKGSILNFSCTEQKNRTIKNNKSNSSYNYFNSQTHNINEMIQYRFWLHKPSNKIVQIKPDVGNHLLFKLHKRSQLVTILNDNITDHLKNFMPVSNVGEQKNQIIKSEKPSKLQIIDQLKAKGDFDNIETLSKMWKIKDIKIT
jgi:hypothetical protein